MGTMNEKRANSTIDCTINICFNRRKKKCNVKIPPGESNIYRERE